MNYQLLLEFHAQGTKISQTEAELLDLELYSQMQSIKFSRTQECLEIAPDHICNAALVFKGSLWITCLVALLDQIIPVQLGTKARVAKVFDELVVNGYLVS